MITAEDYLIKGSKVSTGTNRADVAAFMIKQLTDNQHSKKFIAISFIKTKK